MSLCPAAPQRAEWSSHFVHKAPYVLSGDLSLLCVPFLKRHRTSKCLLDSPQGAVPVLLMESESSVATQSEAVANYVVIMRRCTHLLTGIAQGCDGVSALVLNGQGRNKAQWINAPCEMWQKNLPKCCLEIQRFDMIRSQTELPWPFLDLSC